MSTFPTDFANAIRAWRRPIPVIRGDVDRVRWFPRVIRPEIRRQMLELLETQISPLLRRAARPVDPKTITGMTKNYSESLHKSLRNSTVLLNNPRSAAFKPARETGLTAFLTSPSLQEFAERVSGFQLEPSPGMQVICYKPGDYVGPHNDHHPEESHLRNGYVDLQITLTNDHVERQYLVYESGGFFNRNVNIGISSGVSVSLLPFWHQVTPLIAKPGREAVARRWLLLVSFVCR